MKLSPLLKSDIITPGDWSSPELQRCRHECTFFFLSVIPKQEVIDFSEMWNVYLVLKNGFMALCYTHIFLGNAYIILFYEYIWYWIDIFYVFNHSSQMLSKLLCDWECSNMTNVRILRGNDEDRSHLTTVFNGSLLRSAIENRWARHLILINTSNGQPHKTKLSL